jgi:hypothetical protein
VLLAVRALALSAAGDVGSRDPQCGADAEEQSGDDADCRGKGEDAHVGGGGEGGVRGRSNDKFDEDAGSPEGEQEAERASGEGEQQGLGEHLADDARTT